MDWPEPRRGPFRVNLRISAFHPLLPFERSDRQHSRNVREGWIVLKNSLNH